MTEPDPLDTAWHIHDALCDWTGKVDVKAAFALTIESAVLIAVLTLATDKHRLAGLHGWSRGIFIAGLAGIIVSALSSVLAVCPQIRSGEVKETWPDNFIYFGHLKYWKREALMEALGNTDLLPMLSRQLIVMGEIAWRKHRLLQLSFVALVAGSCLVGCAAWIR